MPVKFSSGLALPLIQKADLPAASAYWKSTIGRALRVGYEACSSLFFERFMYILQVTGITGNPSLGAPHARASA
jgi:hypothetical protein